jgi:hypothetical protein
MLRSHLPVYIFFPAAFSNTKGFSATLSTDPTLQRNFFSHNGVPAEWRGATDALEPEVHVERNSRGKLVVYCADTNF